VFEEQIAGHVAGGRLIRALDSWCVTFPACHLYYPSRRQATPALVALVKVLRARPDHKPST